MSDLLAIFGPNDTDLELLTEIERLHPDRVTVLIEGPETDVTSLCEGYITVTPLHFDLTRHDRLARLAA